MHGQIWLLGSELANFHPLLREVQHQLIDIHIGYIDTVTKIVIFCNLLAWHFCLHIYAKKKKVKIKYQCHSTVVTMSQKMRCWWNVTDCHSI